MDLEGRRFRLARRCRSGRRRFRFGWDALVAALAVTGLIAVGAPSSGAGTPDSPVAEVTVTLVVVGEPPAWALMAFYWACAADTDFTTFPSSGGSQVFPLAAGEECVFSVRDEPPVPSELFAAEISTDTASPDITFTVEPASVRFAAADTATGTPLATGTVTFTATFAAEPPPPPPPPPPAAPIAAAPSFTG